MIRNHEIDYRIFGEEMQYVEVELRSRGNCRCRTRSIYDDGRWHTNGNFVW